MEYNKVKMQAVLEAFHRVTKARVAIFDKNFNELQSYPKALGKICRVLRENGKIDRMCLNSDKCAFKKVANEKCRHDYQCEMGLYESIAPIFSKEKIIGYIMMGQVLTISGKNVLKEKIEKYAIDISRIEKIIEKENVVSYDSLSSVCFLMGICVENLCFEKSVADASLPYIEVIEKYLASNFNLKLSVSSVSDKFGISRVTLYNMFMKKYNENPSCYINRLKMEKVKSLLGENCCIEDILLAVGMEDKNYLSRLFKKTVKMTIREYQFMLENGEYDQ